ncbi:unnamed protein product [Cuscuta europaea]|uniref:Uncharacterized protein n=1 Tax=Cuscuta europaea TaxID=41803 RepID=A0A9P1EKE4_CUSEU|nr:unnamed protein product [Cuscuta europaea]
MTIGSSSIHVAQPSSTRTFTTGSFIFVPAPQPATKATSRLSCWVLQNPVSYHRTDQSYNRPRTITQKWGSKKPRPDRPEPGGLQRCASAGGGAGNHERG